MNQSSQKTADMVQLALWAGIIVVLALTPLGYIPLGFTRATTIHIPVILGSVLLGPKQGAFLGFVFGLTSFLNNTFNPTVTSFVFTPLYSVGDVSGNFWSIVICFVPRILVGITPWLVYRLIKKASKKEALSLGLAGVAGSLTNTLLVMNFIYLFFGDTYSTVNNVAPGALYGFILTLIGINGVPEAIVAGLLTLTVGKALFKFTRRIRPAA